MQFSQKIMHLKTLALFHTASAKKASMKIFQVHQGLKHIHKVIIIKVFRLV